MQVGTDNKMYFLVRYTDRFDMDLENTGHTFHIVNLYILVDIDIGKLHYYSMRFHHLSMGLVNRDLCFHNVFPNSRLGMCKNTNLLESRVVLHFGKDLVHKDPVVDK